MGYVFELQLCPDISPGERLLDHRVVLFVLSCFGFFLGGVFVFLEPHLWYMEVPSTG